jgi:hypothetical protein
MIVVAMLAASKTSVRSITLRNTSLKRGLTVVTFAMGGAAA